METLDDVTRPTVAACDLALLKVVTKPFPHVIHPQFVRPELYGQLCESFPIGLPSTLTGRLSLYWGDDEYQQLLNKHPAWLALFETFHSQRFVDWAREQFGEFWMQAGCKIDLSKARYVPYQEDRIDKTRTTLRKIEYEPHEVWVRMDIFQGREGYFRPIHRDHKRRMLSMLIYLCDHAESRMQGGELLLHSAEQQIPDHEGPTRITPRHNLMVAFPCTSRSHHSVSQITSLVTPRNYVQVLISSSSDSWEEAVSDGGPAGADRGRRDASRNHSWPRRVARALRGK